MADITTTTAPHSKAVQVANAVATFETALRNKMDVVFSAVPDGISRKRLAAVAVQALRMNPDLLTCTPQSFLLAVCQAANLGLEVGTGVFGQAYLIPYGRKGQDKKECQLIIGYKGMLDLARRAGWVKSFANEVVREGDSFAYTGGLHPTCTHEQSTSHDRHTRPVTHVYFCCTLEGGGSVVEVATKAEIDHHMRTYARGYDRTDSPWVTAWDRMACKTVLRRAFASGKVPIRSEIREVIARDDDTIDTTFALVPDELTSEVTND